MLFRCDSVDKEFASQSVLRNLNLQANPGDRIGVIGPNGSGKTTLLNLIEGILEPDRGQILRARGLTLSRIQQRPDFKPQHSVREEALEVFTAIRELERRLQVFQTRISDLGGEIPRDIAEEYEQLAVMLEQQGGYDYPARTEAVLLGVGFTLDQLEQPCSQLSGGQASRLMVAKALLCPAGLLLLDEPTNHLDLDGILWLSRYLGQRRQAFLLVSHDRHFLDSVTESTWELEAGSLFTYVGSYSKARKQRRERRTLERKMFERQQEWKQKTEEYIRRNIAGQKTKQAQARRKRLEKGEWLEAPRDLAASLFLRVGESHRGGSISFELRNASVGYPGKTLLRNLDLVARRGDRIALLGANGSGKTTLLRVIAGELFPSAGEIHFGQNLTPGYLSQSPQFPGSEMSVLDSLRELDPMVTDLELRSYAAAFAFRGEEIGKKVSQLSGGERSRLAMARLFYQSRNLLLLDEPTNHLDVDSRESLENALLEFGGTQIIITHDLFLVRRLANRFWKIEGDQVRELKSIAEVTEPASEEVPTTPLDSRPRGGKKSRALGASPGVLSKNERSRRERELSAVEKQIGELEEEKGLVLLRLENEVDFSILAELGHTHDQLAMRLEALYQSWEELDVQLSGENPQD